MSNEDFIFALVAHCVHRSLELLTISRLFDFLLISIAPVPLRFFRRQYFGPQDLLRYSSAAGKIDAGLLRLVSRLPIGRRLRLRRNWEKLWDRVVLSPARNCSCIWSVDCSPALPHGEAIGCLMGRGLGVGRSLLL